MAELLNQKQIDTLLSEVLSSGEVDSEGNVNSDKAEDSKKIKKIFRPYKKNSSFKFSYMSPTSVLKKEDVVFNPSEKQTFKKESKQVVWSLNKYIEMMKDKKRSKDFFAPF